MRPAESLGSLVVSNMLFGGIFIAIWHSVIKNDPPPGAVMGILALLLLDIGLAVPIVAFAWSMNPDLKLSIWTATFCYLRWSGTIGFGLWFWFHGLDAVNSAQCMEPQVCVFTCAGAYGNIRSFMKFAYIFVATGAFVAWIHWIRFFIYCAFYRTGSFEERWSIMAPLGDLHTRSCNCKDSPRLRWAVALGVFGVLGIVLCLVISGIELEIKYNHLDGLQGIDTTGQIVPLAVGCLSMGRAMGLVIMWMLGALRTEIEQSPDLETMSEFPSLWPSEVHRPKYPNVHAQRNHQSKAKGKMKGKRHEELVEPWMKPGFRKGKPLPPAKARPGLFK